MYLHRTEFLRDAARVIWFRHTGADTVAVMGDDDASVAARAARVIEEWPLYREGRLDHVVRRPWWGDQTWMRLSGSAAEPLRYALTLASGPEQAVAVLGLGPVNEMTDGHNRLLMARRELPREERPPISMRLHGESWIFHAAAGCWLLGVVEARGSVALLGHDGRRVLILLGDGERFELCVALRLVEIPPIIDLDAFVARVPRAGVRCSAPGRPRAREARRLLPRSSPEEISPAVRDHHRRILEGRPCGDDDRATVDQVLDVALGAIARSAATVERPKTRKGNTRPRRAVACVRPILEVLRRMGVDHEGEGTAIYEAFKAYDPGAITMSAEDFVCALGLLVDTGTCLVKHPSRKRWELRGAGIDDPHHPLHRELCKETGTGAGRRAASGRPRRAVEDRAAPGVAVPIVEEAAMGERDVGGTQLGDRVEDSEPWGGPFVVDLGDGGGLPANDVGDPGASSREVTVASGHDLSGAPVVEAATPSPEGGRLVVLVGRSIVREGLASEDEVALYRDLVEPRTSSRTEPSEAPIAVDGEAEFHEVVADRDDAAGLSADAPGSGDREIVRYSGPGTSALKILLEVASRPSPASARGPRNVPARPPATRVPPGTPPSRPWSNAPSWPG